MKWNHDSRMKLMGTYVGTPCIHNLRPLLPKQQNDESNLDAGLPAQLHNITFPDILLRQIMPEALLPDAHFNSYTK